MTQHHREAGEGQSVLEKRSRADTINAMRVVAASLFNLVGGVAGFLAIALVIWRGGALERQVEIDTVRQGKNEDAIAELSKGGSSGLKQHIQMDDERVADLARRLTMAEEATRQAMDLKVEIRVLGTKLDAMVERLKSIEVNATVVKVKP